MSRTLICPLFLLFLCPLFAQQVRFNEVASSNSRFFDEDGDSPDWFELRNTGTTSIALTGWTVTDDAEEPDKWTFPDITMAPDSYLLVWASDKDRTEIGVPRTFITHGDEFRYFLPSGAVNLPWKDPGFDDSAWDLGATSIGYGDGDDATLIPPGTLAVYMRKTFTISNPEEVQELILDIDYDDAFVAYINGIEIARASNINGNPPLPGATLQFDHEAQLYANGLPERFRIDNPDELLQTGENVLAIQGHNMSSASSDFTMIPFLTAIFSGSTNEGSLPPEVLQLNEQTLHTNFKITSEGETLYLFDETGELVDSLEIGVIPHNLSWGLPPGADSFVFYENPSPGLPNEGMGYEGVNEPVIVFSHPGGPTGPLELTLAGVTAPSVIRYTLDATEPDENSPLYSGPIEITTNTVVRARIFRPGYLPSRPQSHSYLVYASHDLPVISLVTEPDHFFSSETGIYVLGDDYSGEFPYFDSNIWQDWERPIHFTLYETDGTLGTAFDGGTKIFGGWSRGHAQRSLSIFARAQYGFNAIEYPLFPDQPYEEYQALVLRNSGNDWLNTNLRDAALTTLLEGAGLEYQAYRPAATYLNGEYWGVYNMREKINEHFVASKHDLDPDKIDLLEFSGDIIHGGNQDYLSLINFVSNNNLSGSNQYQYVADRIDIENYIIYQVAQIYFDNTDWPGNNIKFWRPENGKWRWIIFDTDFSFGIWNNANYLNNTLAFALEANGPGWPNPPWATLLFRRLTQNLTFRNAFVNRFADELNSRFLPTRVHEHIDTLAEAISTEIIAHYERWNGDLPYWHQQILGMKSFASNRPFQVKQHILEVFGLPAYHQLTIDNNETDKGYVKVNRLTIDIPDWSGDYFEEVPVKLIAVAEPGYAFSHWSGGSASTNAEIEVNLTTATTLVPHFTDAEGERSIVINEINYNSSDDFDTEDWVEIYNPNSGFKDLSNWVLKDDDDDHSFVFPEGALIPSGGFLVLTRDMQAFRSFYPNMENVMGDFDFGLSGSGDMVRLYDPDGILQDSVAYLPVAPWPEGANGTGYTIELVHPTLDNTLPENWASFHELGSPGRSNLQDSTFEQSGSKIINLKYFPNPFSNQVNITFNVTQSTQVRAVLYDAKGAEVQLLFDEVLIPGDYHIDKDLEALAKGVYFLRFVEGESKSTFTKWIKV